MRLPLSSETQSCRPKCSSLCSLISIDGSEAGGPEVSEREAAATSATMECIRACHVDAIFADCAYLRPDALLALARAVVWAAGGSAGIGDTDTAEVRSQVFGNLQRSTFSFWRGMPWPCLWLACTDTPLIGLQSSSSRSGCRRAELCRVTCRRLLCSCAWSCC